MFNKALLLYLLNERGWSKYKLCKEANLAQSTLSDILNDKNKNPRMDTIQKIADALGVNVYEFFDEGLPVNNEDIENWDDNLKNTEINQSSNIISSPLDGDLKRIERARSKMDSKNKEKMMKILEASFDEYFKD